MQVFISLILAMSQLVLVGFAAAAATPPQADALNSRPLQQELTLSEGSLQLQPDDGSSTDSSVAAPSGSTMRVQIDMMSGRPNPSWEITPQEADQVRSAFRQLPERGSGSRSDRLGYRGVIVEGDGVHDLGLTRLLVGGGIVIAESIQGVRYYSDADRSFERQLFETGRTRLDPTDYAAFKSIAFP